MFIKMSVREFEENSGCSVEDIKMCDKKVVCVYDREDGSSSIGCKYEDGSYSVVGLNRDCMCDYRYMFSRVMEG